MVEPFLIKSVRGKKFYIDEVVNTKTKMNKKGYIRTLEAIIAIIIIFIFILSVLPKKESEEQVPKDIDLTAEQILNEIQNNKDYRDRVFSDFLTNENCKDNYGYIKDFIMKNVPITIGFELLICSDQGCFIGTKYRTTWACSQKEPSEVFGEKELLNIYTKNLLITKDGGEERVVRLFLWRKA